jgi:hypothetical protein
VDDLIHGADEFVFFELLLDDSFHPVLLSDLTKSLFLTQIGSNANRARSGFHTAFFVS